MNMNSGSKPKVSAHVKAFTAQTPGEAFVWLTAMGLCLGLLMIIGLLGVVVWNGLEAFWPRKVIEITVQEEPEAMLHGSATFGGEVVKIQPNYNYNRRNLSASEERPLTNVEPPEFIEEWQLFVGSKDAFGLSFKYVTRSSITNIDSPNDVIRVERLKNDPAFIYAQRLVEGTNVLATPEDEGFSRQLRETVEAAEERRDRIHEIEKDRIGDINETMTELRNRRSYLQEQGLLEERSEETERIDARLVQLQEEFEVLAAQARQLRGQQEAVTLFYTLMTGREQSMPVGEIVDFYYPNRLTAMERTGRFLHNGWVFLSDDPRNANTEGGVFPAIFGTAVMTILMSIVVMPLGVLAAIYLREYAHQGTFTRSVRIAVNNLAGVPSIVFGVFGLGFFVYLIGGTIDSLFFEEALPTPTFGTGGILWASLTLALLTVPVVIVATEEALAAVPRGTREGALACGASKWQTIQRTVLPASAPGILTGLILAMARATGEVAPLMLVGVIKYAPELPLSLDPPFVHFNQKFMHLGFHIYDLGFQSPDSEAAKPMVFATTLLLIALVVALNLTAIVIRERLRRKYAMGAF